MKLAVKSFFLYVIVMAYFCSCTAMQQKPCARTYMNGYRFRYISKAFSNSYFIMRDSIQTEFADDSVFARSKIVWVNCNNYLLIVKEANYTDGLRVGDTLNVKVLSVRGDTIEVAAGALGQSYRFRYLKSNVHD